MIHRFEVECASRRVIAMVRHVVKSQCIMQWMFWLRCDMGSSQVTWASTNHRLSTSNRCPVPLFNRVWITCRNLTQRVLPFHLHVLSLPCVQQSLSAWYGRFPEATPIELYVNTARHAILQQCGRYRQKNWLEEAKKQCLWIESWNEDTRGDSMPPSSAILHAPRCINS